MNAAAGLVLLLGFAGLAIDMGLARYERRIQQTAADAAAVAGVNDLAQGSWAAARPEEAKVRRRNEAGNVLVFTALALTVLMGMVGLAVDLGAMRYEKRLQQTAADAAAIAGASNLPYYAAGSTGITSAAKGAAQANGFADTGTYCSGSCPGSGAVGYITVTVNNPPQSGPHGCNGGTCDSGYVEALVSAVQPTSHCCNSSQDWALPRESSLTATSILPDTSRYVAGRLP